MQFGEEMCRTSHGRIQGDTLFRLLEVCRGRASGFGIRRRCRPTLHSKSRFTGSWPFPAGTLSNRGQTLPEHVHVSCIVGLEVDLRRRERVTIDRIRSTGSHREDAVPLRPRMRHDATETRAWDAIVQGASNNQVLQVSDEIRRMGLDAIVRHDCAQFPKLATALHRVGQLRVDETGEHRFAVELRAKVVLLESEQSAQHPFDHTDHQRNRERVGQSQPQFTSVSNQIERIAR